MTFAELQAHCMAQTNNDRDDLEDFLPFVRHYLNEGYDLLIGVWEPGKHIEYEVPQPDGPTVGYPVLLESDDAPRLPYWVHRYIADYATWLLYRNGNPQKQQRGERYRLLFEEGRARLAAEGGKAGADLIAEAGSADAMNHFVNLYPDRPQRYEPERGPVGYDPFEG